MPLTDAIAIPAGCGCCGSGACSCPGSDAPELCLSVSGFPNGGIYPVANQENGYGSPQPIWLNGRYRLQSVATPGGPADNRVWAVMVPTADGGTRPGSGPAAGGDGCEDTMSASVECSASRVRVLLAATSTTWGRYAEAGAEATFYYSLNVPNAAAGCATLEVSGDATWDATLNRSPAAPPASGLGYAIPASIAVSVSLTACQTGGGVRYNAFCPDSPPLIYDPDPAPYPPYLYATYARAPAGNFVLQGGQVVSAFDGSGDGGAPECRTGTADGKTLRFELFYAAPCTPGYRWCGKTAWHNYYEKQGPPGQPVPGIITSQSDTHITVDMTSIRGPFGVPVVHVGQPGYASGGTGPPLGPGSSANYGESTRLWVNARKPGRPAGGGCYDYSRRISTSYTSYFSNTAGGGAPGGEVVGYTETVSATPPAGGTLVLSDCATYGYGPPATMAAAAPPGYAAPAGEPDLGSGTYVTTARLAGDAASLASRVPSTVDAVAGVVRSGLLPAGVIATHRHLPLLTAHRAAGVLAPGGGHRTAGGATPTPTHVLVVDDTVYTGRAMAEAVAQVRQAYPDATVTTAAVYADPATRHLVDLAHATSANHYLEWNWANSGHADACAFDFDGVICRDPVAGDDDGDGGERYAAFLREALPLHLPRKVTVPLIVTARPESARAATLDWLGRHGVTVTKLVMRDFDRPTFDDWARVAGEFKAKHYLESSCTLFAESDPAQAEVIARVTGRPVLCPGVGRLLHYPPPPTPPPAPRGPCSSLGEPITSAAASRLNLSTLREWRPCARGRGKAGHVCQCDAAASCSGCPEWTPAAAEAAPAYGDVRDLIDALPGRSPLWESDGWRTDPLWYPSYAKVYRALRPTSILEVGTLFGYSLCAAVGTLPGLARVEWIDDESGEADSNAVATRNVAFAAARRDPATPLATRHWRTTDGAVPTLPVGVAHIDGHHSLEAVRRDLAWVRALPTPPEFVIGHDIAPLASGVRQAVEEAFGRRGIDWLEVVNLTHGLFVAPLASARTVPELRADLSREGLDVL